MWQELELDDQQKPGIILAVSTLLSVVKWGMQFSFVHCDALNSSTFVFLRKSSEYPFLLQKKRQGIRESKVVTKMQREAFSHGPGRKPFSSAHYQWPIVSAYPETTLVSPEVSHLHVLIEAHATKFSPRPPKLYFWGIRDSSLSTYKIRVK